MGGISNELRGREKVQLEGKGSDRTKKERHSLELSFMQRKQPQLGERNGAVRVS